MGRPPSNGGPAFRFNTVEGKWRLSCKPTITLYQYVKYSRPSLRAMDPKHSGDMLKHLEKQTELLTDSYRSMSHELQRLQVEEEMLMHKYYEFMEAQGLIKKKQSNNMKTEEETGKAGEVD